MDPDKFKKLYLDGLEYFLNQHYTIALTGIGLTVSRAVVELNKYFQNEFVRLRPEVNNKKIWVDYLSYISHSNFNEDVDQLNTRLSEYLKPYQFRVKKKGTVASRQYRYSSIHWKIPTGEGFFGRLKLTLSLASHVNARRERGSRIRLGVSTEKGANDVRPFALSAKTGEFGYRVNPTIFISRYLGLDIEHRVDTVLCSNWTNFYINLRCMEWLDNILKNLYPDTDSSGVRVQDEIKNQIRVPVVNMIHRVQNSIIERVSSVHKHVGK